MTRINCVPVAELSDKHLGAEYRELPRVFKLAEAAYHRGDNPERFPQAYTLGTGHVKFFYARLGYLSRRYGEIIYECMKRGRVVNFPKPPFVAIPLAWCADWQPTPEALAINRQRIKDRS